MTPTDSSKKKTRGTGSRRTAGATPSAAPKQTCPSCRAENPGDSQFCGKCATPLKSTGGGTAVVSQTIRATPADLSRGHRLAGRYEIIEELGQGGMGKVFRVYDHKISEVIALKLIRPEIGVQDKAIERFKNELKFTRKITHRNICRMYDLGDVDFIHYITMEYVAGEDLKRFIKRAGVLSPGKAIAIAKQVCDGLAEAHRIGAVHRDLKSPNIMIDQEGNAKIMDFGIARFVDMDRMTGSGVMIGTPEYMSPEQVDLKEVDARADLYSLGVVLYEMLTGKVPFEGETAISLAMKHKMEKPRDVREWSPQVSPGLAAVVEKCLEKEPDKRYQSAEELRAALESVEGELATGERPAPRVPAPSTVKTKAKPAPKVKTKATEKTPVSLKPVFLKLGRTKLVPVIAGLAVIAVLAVVFFVIKPGAGPSPTTPAESSFLRIFSLPLFPGNAGTAPGDSSQAAATDVPEGTTTEAPEKAKTEAATAKVSAPKPNKPAPQTEIVQPAEKTPPPAAEKGKPDTAASFFAGVPATEDQVTLAKRRLLGPKDKALKSGIDPKSPFYAAAEAREKEAQGYADRKRNAEARCLFSVSEKLYRLCLDESKDENRLRSLSRYVGDLKDQARRTTSGEPLETLFTQAAEILTEGEIARESGAAEHALKSLVEAAVQFEKIRWAGQQAKDK
jgi:serine/threonine protein kinase